MKNLRSKLPIILMSILLALVGWLGYDNYQREQKIQELDAALDVYSKVAASYMIQYARCVRYVQIMEERKERH